MSYASGAALQAAVYTCLTGHAGLADIVVADALPPGTPPETWVRIGAEEVRDASDQTAAGAEHRLEISVLSQAEGFADAKSVAAEITEALAPGALALTGVVVRGPWFLGAKAVRSRRSGERRIDLTFRVRLDFGAE